MSIVEFKPPSFVDNADARSIVKRMMNQLPKDIDKTEGGFAWDFAYPTALEKAEMLQFHLVWTLMQMYHMWATGEYLDLHASENGLERKPATRAYGTVTVTGKVGLVIPAGFVFAVPSDNGVAAIEFASVEDATIGSEGTVNINVQAIESGKGSNVDADTITIMREPMKGIENITNSEPITGGVIEETDDQLRTRIDELLANNKSHVGCNADYIRWAKEVPGVGYCHVIPQYNGPNSVKLIIVDANGSPANEQICQNVYTHIYGTGERDPARLISVGWTDFAVSPPTAVDVTFSFKLKLKDGYTVDSVKTEFASKLLAYYEEITIEADNNDKVVKLIMVGSILANVNGVEDYDDLMMNGSDENITCTEEQYPVTAGFEVTLYE